MWAVVPVCMVASVWPSSGIRKGMCWHQSLGSTVSLTPSRLDRLKSQDGLSRDDPPYTTMYYRAHWQPLCAYFGLLCFSLLVIFSGWDAIYILSARRKLDDGLKSNARLAADLIGSYSGVMCPFRPIMFGPRLTSYSSRSYSSLFTSPGSVSTVPE